MNPLAQGFLGSVLGAATVSGDGPWRSKTVLLALCAVLVGLGLWLRDAAHGPPTSSSPPAVASAPLPAQDGGWDFSQPVPAYVRLCASYIGGFFIGWAFRRFLRLALAAVALALLLLGVARYAGWNTGPVQTKVREQASRARHEAVLARDYLKGLLPSTAAGAVGLFLGFRRRDKAPAPRPDQPIAS